MKKLLIFMLSVVIVLSFSVAFIGCKSEPKVVVETVTETVVETVEVEKVKENEEEKEFNPADHTLYAVLPLKGHPVLRQMVMGFLLAGREMGYNVKWLSYDGIEPSDDIAMIEQAIAEGAAGIACQPYAGSAFDAVVEKATDTGIPVVAIHHPSTDAFTSWVGADQKEIASNVGEAVAEAIDGEGQVAITQGALWSELEALLTTYYKIYFSENYPDIEVVVIEEEGYDPAEAIQKAVSIIQRFPNLAAGISTTGGGATTWAKAQEETSHKLISISNDTTEQNLDFLSNGEVYGLVYQAIVEEHYKSAEILDRAIRDQEVGPRYFVETDLVLKDQQDKIESYYEQAEKVDETLAEFGY
jgi:ABC-type sugar transport system substrate-binding protein